MKLSITEKWNELIYTLIYPGFLGSMIYELFPLTKDDFFTLKYFTLPTILKLLITIFYSVDFLHLYSDMHKAVPESKRSKTYLYCDILVSLSFFLAFLAVKFKFYELGLLLISTIPIFFFAYKRELKKIYDLWFYLPYLLASLGFGVLYFVNSIFNLEWDLFSKTDKFFLIFILGSLIMYSLYVFCYYEVMKKREEEGKNVKLMVKFNQLMIKFHIWKD
jgi:hypothetical protein